MYRYIHSSSDITDLATYLDKNSYISRTIEDVKHKYSCEYIQEVCEDSGLYAFEYIADHLFDLLVSDGVLQENYDSTISVPEFSITESKQDMLYRLSNYVESRSRRKPMKVFCKYIGWKK